ncbi:uncharacterized protein LOC122316166 [Carya illinoinensis]|uniref:uncharacterized protein LOC122316166 n=1 Tax=Carya illinoinensis TaxID=32201 RepID=UPI001C722AF1|nr:uncharacterized protein LOC122316166 [Carya illinoinensis]
MVMRCIPEVLQHSRWWVIDGDVVLWWDQWSPLEPLGHTYEDIARPLLSLRECKSEMVWNEELLTSLLGREKAMEVLMHLGNSRQGPNKLIWMWKSDGGFSMKNAWEVTRLRGSELPWTNWIWNLALPKNISITMWQAFHGGLSVDDKLCKVGVLIVSKCVCCDFGAYEDIEHILAKGEMAQHI